ncbi:MAG TPA: isoprenylcysteine carboxylmethyltransferase family protein [Verrucomicrobiae bacterium]|jgi:protein-S-isoprenylcysteine O-methyltransferase Ste14|nr:isoprenylcysteine carboxylmethyltransferase family protein [Verrucomicrobiae bacterium]
MHAPLLGRLYLDAWLVALLVWIIAALFVKRAERSEPLGSRLIHLGWAAVAAVLLSFRRLPWAPLNVRVIPRSFVLGNLGLLMTVGGIAFAIWARFYIGRNWSGRVTIKKDHELIRSGPYAIVRHPIYAGLLVALAGTTIAIGQIRAILALAIIAIGLHFKARTEEKFMREQFGEEYARYEREVKSLIPWIV